AQELHDEIGQTLTAVLLQLTGRSAGARMRFRGGGHLRPFA
ncbi:histidine kinase, partial [Streptomyces yangpuensis]